MNYLDFHSVIQPQPDVNNIPWSDEDCDYIFPVASSEACPCGASSSSSLQSLEF